jgi:hypothetical protein
VDLPLEFVARGSEVQLTLPVIGTANPEEGVVELFVPSQYNLQLETAGGGIFINDVVGSLEALTVDGLVRLERFQGSMDVTAARGNFEMYDSDLVGEFRTDKGSAMSGRIRGNFRSSPWAN